MKRVSLLLILLLVSISSFSQVGIGTTNPESTLDVRAQNHQGAVTSMDGILVPRVNALGVSATINGQLVYLIADAGGFSKGFHYWDGSAWAPILNSQNYGRQADLPSLNALASSPTVGSSAVLTDATGLTLYDGSAINTSASAYFVTYKDYGSGNEWRVTLEAGATTSCQACSTDPIAANTADAGTITDAETGLTITTQFNTAGMSLSALDNGVWLVTPYNAEYEWLFDNPIEQVVFTSSYFGDQGVELNELEFYDENNSLITNADTYATASNVAYSITNSSGVVTVTNTGVLAATESVTFSFGTQKLSRIVIRGDGTNIPNIVWKITEHCEQTVSDPITSDEQIVGCDLTLPESNGGVVRFGVTSTTRIDFQGEANNTLWASNYNFLYNSATPDWVDLSGSTINIPNSSARARHTLPAVIVDGQTLSLVDGQTRWSGTSTSGTYENGSSANGMSTGYPLFTILNNKAINEGNGCVIPATDGGYWFFVSSSSGATYDTNGDGTVDVAAHDVMKFNADWTLDTTYANTADYINAIGGVAFYAGSTFYTQPDYSDDFFYVYDRTTGANVGTVTIPAIADQGSSLNRITQIHLGQDGRTYFLTMDGWILSVDAGQITGDVRVHMDTDNQYSTFIVKPNGDMYVANNVQATDFINDQLGGSYPNPEPAGIQKFTQSGGYTIRDASWRTSLEALTSDPAVLNSVQQVHQSEEYIAIETVFNSDDVTFDINGLQTITPIQGQTLRVTTTGSFYDWYRWDYELTRGGTQAFERADGTLFSFASSGNAHEIDDKQINYRDVIYDYNDATGYSAVWITQAGVPIASGLVEVVDENGDPCP